MAGFAFRFLGAGAAIVGLNVAGKSMYDSIAGSWNADIVRNDSSRASVGVKKQVPQQIVLEYRDVDGEMKLGVVDEHKYKKAVAQKAIELERQKAELQLQTVGALHTEIERSFAPVYDRIPLLADWYFSYSTSYRLIAKATMSALSHTASFTRRESLQEAVSRDIEEFIQTKYKKIVLRPELTDPALQKAFNEAVREGHVRFTECLSRAESDLRSLVQTNTSHLKEVPSGKLTLDWKTQLAKASSLPTNFEKSPAQSLGLLAAGSIAGKATGVAAIKASTPVAGKLAAPFVGKGVAASGLGAAAGAVGTAVAGPGGAVLGAGVGVGVDMMLNKGAELMQRSDFERDVREAVAATQLEWEEKAAAELRRIVDVWVSDTIQLLPSMA
eukprot:Sspe_Gene.1487::Locus_489_Transcript_1_1_Confidence_1.000_Length_2063::g.1487::m.1487